MRFATLRLDGTEQAAVLCSGDRWAPLHHIDPRLRGDLLRLIAEEPSRENLANLAQAGESLAGEQFVERAAAVYTMPYRPTGKIWGIGLNYRDHAADLSADSPAQPASFMKGAHTVIGPGEPIVVPSQSERTTSEAELGLVIGRRIRGIDRRDALDSLFGFCVVLDQTAEDILQLNPRYLTRSKNFETFFSFGPEVVTPDELIGEGRLGDIEVATVRNGEIVRRNTVDNMMHSPEEILRFHADMMPFLPGDLISTGTPGAAVIAPGDRMEARVDHLEPLVNDVVGAGERA
ncbi:hypothetical protein BHE97_04025 [Aeromicrobium sp. PE09-221]|uniref:fumarylacetoacetate hydrolase family protein n=1 Tax=Aeromicrobium sp. PE09-221 TaxID=1898043 RepID=UPI000B3ECC7B|nr:fumarylacetoacetate hydrolase family protein [Aeromicrobium sp. PE09-221]OUZ11681.1 hypothetical protein BHE97_04025 [Aeromicrobium sp. PE09-221]